VEFETMQFQMPAREAAKTRHPVQVHGKTYMISDYVGAGPLRGMYVEGNERNDNGLPQGFLVEQPPFAVTPPHFHEHQQFQVFTHGHGRIGKHATAPVSVHYANAHTPYGPIVAGEEGVHYFTLRRGWDPGAKYMPAAREKLVKGRQRAALTGELRQDAPEALRARREIAAECIMGPEPDGLAAWIYRVGAGQAFQTPDPAGSDGQYHLVIQGSALREGDTLDLWSCAFVSGDDAPLAYAAGADGVELLVCQFPRY